MTSAADEAAAALLASKTINQGQQSLTEESRLLLAAMLRDEMRLAVAEGFEAVLTNEETWAKVFTVLQKQAAERTGKFFFSGVAVVFKKFLWLSTFLLIAYALGGWSMVKIIWASLAKGN